MGGCSSRPKSSYWNDCAWTTKEVYTECDGCAAGYTNDGLFCRRDVHTYAKGSYVPTTRSKSSYVPTTRARASYVPTTNPKPSYGRGAGTPLICAPGEEAIGALCYNSCAVHNTATTTYERRTDNLEFCSTKCPSGFTNIGIGGCVRPKVSVPSKPLECAPGRELIGALCYDNCNVYNNGTTTYERRNDNLEFCSTACPSGFTNIGIGGCQRPRVDVTSKPLECAPGRELIGALCYDNCNVYNNGTTSYERRKDNLEFCSTACPSDFTNIGIGGCQRPRWHADSTSMVCPPNKREYSTSLGLCYDDCNVVAGIAEIKDGKVVKKSGQENNNYTMQSAGLCSQECPSGVLFDFGVGCTRQQFNRGTGVPGWSLRFKERKVPYGTK